MEKIFEKFRTILSVVYLNQQNAIKLIVMTSDISIEFKLINNFESSAEIGSKYAVHTQIEDCQALK